MTVVVTGSDLTLVDVVRVAREHASVELGDGAVARMRSTRAVVEQALDAGEPVYGLSTGVGVRKRVRVEPELQPAFNRMLLLGHRVAQGPVAPDDAVRAAMLRLLNGLAAGWAGVRPELAERLVEALNDGHRPRVRLLGSVGEADLPQNADLAHELFAEFPLAAREGLALVNTNAFSTGLAALAVADAQRLLDTLDVAGALDLEAFAANASILHPALAEARPYPGLRHTLARLTALLEGSYLWNAPARNLQDPLTFRCLPQVHGAARDALRFALGQLEVELNASQDNPFVVAAEARIVSAGNFEILPVAAALDFLRIALAPPVTSAAERLLKLMQAPQSGLPTGLSAREGLVDDTLSEFGVPAQALAAEARLLAQPVSFEQVTSSHHEGIEDRITMAPLAARRLGELVALAERLVAIELLVAAQAIDLRGRPPLGAGTGRAYELVRERVPFTGEGEPPPPDLERVVDLVRSGRLRGE